MYRKYKRLQGGFLWEWYDHGTYTEEDGEIYYKYGGNYGDFPTNGNFCIDGILMPGRTPSPGMEEYKQIIAPVDITGVEGSMRKICISNDYDFLDLDAVALHWEVVAEDVAIQEGYFAEEGIDLNLVTGFGADKTMTAVLSGEADIGFMGAEATIYAYAEGA